jgi:predicted short-subunit dehydrogenase-like oxidoreductase (DUF2520 family)
MALFDKHSRIGFIGAGTVGGSLALALANHGYPVVTVASRTLSSARRFATRMPDCSVSQSFQEVADRCNVVFITTSDDAIAPIATSITWRVGQGVVHCSGAASLEVFDKPVKQGVTPGALHPLQAFSSVENGLKSFPGTTFGIEAHEDIRAYLTTMARTIGGHPIYLESEDKVLYHLSGTMMGNLLTCLVGVAAQIWERFDYSRADGVKALVPMMRAVANNLESSGIPCAVAGPYPRGDIGTVRKHLEALRSRVPDILPLYCELALAGLPYAIEKGSLQPDRATEIQELIARYRSTS